MSFRVVSFSVRRQFLQSTTIARRSITTTQRQSTTTTTTTNNNQSSTSSVYSTTQQLLSQQHAFRTNTLLSISKRNSASLPPHEVMGLPALSPTMEKGNLVAWRKKEGDKIKPGEIIAEIETDKAVMEFEAVESSILAKILVPAGTSNLVVGTPIAFTVKNANDVAAFANATAPTANAPPQAAAAAAPAASNQPQQPQKQQQQTQPPQQQSNNASKGRELPAGFTLMGMPALSPTMEQGVLSKWRKQPGDKIKPGEIIADIETDKASMEFEAQEKAVLAKLLVPNGSSGIRVGAPIAIIASSDSADISKVASFELSDFAAAASTGGGNAAAAVAATTPTPPQQQSQPSQPSQQQSQAPQQSQQQSGGPSSVSPFVRSKLRAAGIDASQLPQGTGPFGRFVERDWVNIDVNALKSGRTQPTSTSTSTKTATLGDILPSGDSELIPHSNVRRVTAQRLTESKQQIPHYYLTMEMNVDNVLALRERVGKANPDTPKPSVNDFVVRASAAALRAVPDVNSSWSKDAMIRHHNIDVCVAVATDRGLLTPIVQNADQLGVNEIAAATRSLAARARDGKLKPHEFQGGTFTISNLGMFGISQFTAVINPPQAAILAVGTIEKRVVPTKDGAVAVANILTVTLSCDHRVIDGAVGATWLQKFKSFMEDPMSMIL